MEGKKGLPHLFNNGKPSEMDAKSFYNFLNAIHIDTFLS